MGQYFSEWYERPGGNVSTELDLSNYTIMFDLIIEQLTHLHWYQKQILAKFKN